MRIWVWSLASLRGLKIRHCHELWCRLQMWLHFNPVLLWLWCRPAAAAPIWSLAWELPYAVGTALKSLKKKKTVQRIVSCPYCYCPDFKNYFIIFTFSLSYARHFFFIVKVFLPTWPWPIGPLPWSPRRLPSAQLWCPYLFIHELC